MIPADLRAAIARARESTDPRDHALTELADLAEERVLAHDALMGAFLHGGDSADARRRLLEVDWPLRFALGMPTRARRPRTEPPTPRSRWRIVTVSVLIGLVLGTMIELRLRETDAEMRHQACERELRCATNPAGCTP